MNSKKPFVFLIVILAQTRCQTRVGDRCVENYTKTFGKCTLAEDCNTARNDYQQNGIRPTFCTYSAFGTTLVCCRDGSSILNTPRPNAPPVWDVDLNRQKDNRRVSERSDEDYYTETYPADEDLFEDDHNHVKRSETTNKNNSSPSEEELLSQLWAIKLKKLTKEQRRIAEKMINDILYEAEIECEEYSREVVERVEYIPLLPNPETISLTSAKCDYIGIQLIVGGEKASQGEFPHMAAIGWSNLDGGYDFKCGGSLISNKFVLTAGHCIRDPALRSAPAVVRLGDQNIDPAVDDGADPIEVPIKQIHKHPEYNPPSKYNDIALLELASEVSFESAIRPACLWTRPDFGAHNMAIATGWGVTDPDTRETSKELHKVSLSLFTNNYCNPLLSSYRNRLWRDGFRDTQMCAGELRGGKDTCQGDSGSPLQVVSKENQCIFNVVGITSFGVKCAKAGQPAVYTRVFSYLNWIESIVWPGE